MKHCLHKRLAFYFCSSCFTQRLKRDDLKEKSPENHLSRYYIRKIRYPKHRVFSKKPFVCLKKGLPNDVLWQIIQFRGVQF